jgi:hypothetical protein
MVLITTLLAAFVSAQTQCTPRVRPEYNSLSAEIKQNFINTMNRAREAGIMTRMARFHAEHAPWIHSNAGQQPANGVTFLYWHRAFLLIFETEVRTIDPNFSIPYFDSMRYSVNWRNSDLFGRTNNFANRLILNENMPNEAEWRATQFDQQNRRFRSLDDFALLSEFVHAVPHNNVGGAMATMESPLDPFFFMHHAFIDAQFQLMMSRFHDGDIYGTGMFNAQRQWVNPEGRTNLPGFADSNLYGLARQCITYPGLQFASLGQAQSVRPARSQKAVNTKKELTGSPLSDIGNFSCSSARF